MLIERLAADAKFAVEYPRVALALGFEPETRRRIIVRRHAMICQRKRVKITITKRNAMNQTVRLVIPSAPAPAQSSDVRITQRHISRISGKGIRLGVLDNSKGNADHLLKMIVEGVRAQVPLASVVFTRKPYVSMAAPPEILDKLALEADIVISAMAD